jgi:phage terminase large subunit-like protein
VRAGPKPQPTASTLPRLRARLPSARFAEFCRRFLTHSQGPLAGSPLFLRPWQREIARALLDTRDERGLRRYRVAFITMARRNGKTVLCAALALFELYYGEAGGEIIGAAGDRQQAHLAFDTARKMVEASPPLEAVSLIYRRQLVVPHRGSTYRVVSSDAPRQHGINVSFAIIDELHAHKDRRLFDALSTATGSRAQPLIVVISTATDDPHSVMAELYDYALKVRDGIVPDDAFLPIIFSVPMDRDPWDETAWPLANPALGDFRDLTEFRIAARQAKEIPGREAAYRSLYLNQMFTGAASRWLDVGAWDACATASRDDMQLARIVDDRENGRGLPLRRAFIGLDLSTKVDLSALVILMPDDAGNYDVRAEFFVPADNIARRAQADRVPYPQWVRDQWITATPGNVIDWGVIRARLLALMRDYDVVEIAADPWNAAGFIAELQRDGLPAFEQSQAMAALTSACKELEALVLSQKLTHDGNPVLRWCVSNAVADVDANGNLRPSKKRSTERIDGVSALLNALARALVHAGPSVYESRPPVLLDL